MANLCRDSNSNIENVFTEKEGNMQVLDLSEYKRIGISGAHGVGKTTLATKLSRISDLPLIPEFARDLLKLTHFNWRNPAKEDLVSWARFESAILLSYLFCVRTMPSFVADRTIFDVFSYILLQVAKYPFLAEYFVQARKCVESVDKLYDVILLYELPDGYDDRDGFFIHHCLERMLDGIKNDVRVIKINRDDKIYYGASYVTV